MNTQTLTLDVPAGAMPVYEALPDGPARGAVIVIQEAFGVNHHIEDVTRRLAAAGYHAVAPHVFHRTGAPAFGYDDFSVVVEHIMALGDAELMDDVEAVVSYLRAAGWTERQMGIVGFCMGGRVTFLAASHLALGAGVGFYGGGVVHAAGAGATTWHGLAMATFEAASRHGRPIPAVDAIATAEYPTPAPRPANSRLDCTRLEHIFGQKLPPWRDSVDRVVDTLLGATVS